MGERERRDPTKMSRDTKKWRENDTERWREGRGRKETKKTIVMINNVPIDR